MSTVKTRLFLSAARALPLLAACVFGQTVTVGVYDFEPISSPEAPGKSQGLFPELLEHIAQREGWDIRYKPGSLHHCFERLAAEKIDLVLAAPYSNENAKQFEFSRETVISTWAQVYVAGGKQAMQSPLELRDRIIGLVRDDPYNQELRTTLKRFSIEATFVEFKQYENVFSALEKKWIDAGVVDRLYGVREEKHFSVQRTPLIFSPVELRFAGAKNGPSRERIAAIDFHISALKKNPRSLYYHSVGQTLGESDTTAILDILAWVLVALCGALLLVLIMILLLRHQVKIKTSELSQKNDELEREIANRREAEEALLQSTRFLEEIFASMRDGLLILSGSESFAIVHCNRAAAELLDYDQPELLALSPHALVPEGELHEPLTAEISREIEREGYFVRELRLNRKNGEPVQCELLATPIYSHGSQQSLVLIARDISLRNALKESENRLRQAQKMEAIGTLAGGIAHDFNNILMSLMGYTELLRLSLKNNASEQQVFYLNQVNQASNRAKELVHQILAFSRQRAQEKRPLQITPVVKEALKLLRASLPSTIEIKLTLKAKNDTVNADPTEIHQVLMNLCTNASHAMTEKGGTLEVRLVDHDGGAPRGWTDAVEAIAQPMIVLSVCDTGHGISPAILNRVFDPFFTTKEQGEGTGMGLAVVHGIAKSSGGLVSVETELGGGTTVHVYFPKAEQAPVSARKPKRKGLIGRGERILFVDDERMIADMGEDILCELNYEVVTSTDSCKALALFEKDPAKFDIVITDYTMPRMTGLDMAKRMLELRPELPIILCTGFSSTITPESAKKAGIREFMLKPVPPDAMANVIKRTLAKQKKQDVATERNA